MADNKHLLLPLNDGLRKDLKPIAIPNDGFDSITNAYQWRGRIVRRSGYTKLGRLQLSFTIPGGTFLVAAQINLLSAFGLSASFSIIPGSIDVVGGTDGTTYTDPAKDGTLLATGGTGVGGSINYASGLLTITAGGNQPITGSFAYAQNLPVMGLRTQEEFGIDLQSLIAFDTTTSYEFNGTTFSLLPTIMPVVWSGTDYQFFYSINYAGAFWATNNKPGLNGFKITSFTAAAGAGPYTVDVTTQVANNFQVGDQIYFINVVGTGSSANNNFKTATVLTAGNPFTVTSPVGPFENGVLTSGIALSTTRQRPGQDGIRFYGTLSNGTGWANYNPPLDSSNALAGAQFIFPYRGYLVFLNTWEGNDSGVFNYGNRARWTQIGTPYYQPPTPQTPNIFGFDIDAARDDLFGKGGANDAPTSEVIVGAAFIRDILIVYFERSTWRLRFVNNAQNPFVWERVNVELGASCPFSSIAFDKGLMAIGNRGIVISDGNDTVRFDEKIPDEIFNIRQTSNGFYRVNGIRTFRTKLNYWTFPDVSNPNGIYPDKVLIYNYDTKNWAFFDDVFTCFGYYYNQGTGLTWNDLPNAWSSYGDKSWNTGVSDTGYEFIIAGNQQGYVLQLDENFEGANSENDPSLTISAINIGTSPATFTSANNNLPDGTWITLSGVVGTTSSDGVSLNGRNFKVANPTVDPNDFFIQEFKPIDGGLAVGSSYTYTVAYNYILQGSPQINIGTLVFKDPTATGVLVESSNLGSGTIDYTSGQINLLFTPPILSTAVNIRIVSLDDNQKLEIVNCIAAYDGGGEIAKISNIDIQSKYFNFFSSDQRARISKIDFYVNSTSCGQFICNVFGDSSNDPINAPLLDNLQSNVVLTSTNPYQIGLGEETIYRLYCDALAQTIQLQVTMNDAQMAVSAINRSDIEIVAMVIDSRPGGRLV